MRYYTYKKKTPSFFTNIFEAVTDYRDAKIDDDLDYCTIGVEVGISSWDVYYKQYEDDRVVDVITPETQVLIDNYFKYVNDEIKKEIEALIEVIIADPF